MTIDLKIANPPLLVATPEISELEAAIKEIFLEEAAKAGVEYELYPSDPVNFVLKAITLVSLFQLRQMAEGDRSAFLAYARGESLNNLGDLFGEKRSRVGEDADGQPIWDIPDDQFRENIRTAFDDVSTGGSRASYIKNVQKSPYGRFIVDVAPFAPEPERDEQRDGTVNVPVILSAAYPPRVEGENLSESDVATKRREALSAIRDYLIERSPISDSIFVYEAFPVNFRIVADLEVKAGVSEGLVLKDAEEALLRYLETQSKIGDKVTRTGIIAALFAGDRGRFNVIDVNLTEPASDIVTKPDEYPAISQLTENGLSRPDITLKGPGTRRAAR